MILPAGTGHQDDVVRLEVAVNHAHLVCAPEARGDLYREIERTEFGERTSLYSREK